MTDPTKNTGTPVKHVEYQPDKTTPLRRRLDLYAHRAVDIDAPFEIIEHRGRKYALISRYSFPWGWNSTFWKSARKGYYDELTLTIDGYYLVTVAAVALAAGETLIVEGVRRQRGGDTPFARYVYKNPAAPTK